MFYRKLIIQNIFRKTKNKVYAKFLDVFMTKSILESIGMKDTKRWYDYFHLKLNLEKALLCKWKILYQTIESMC